MQAPGSHRTYPRAEPTCPCQGIGGETKVSNQLHIPSSQPCVVLERQILMIHPWKNLFKGIIESHKALEQESLRLFCLEEIHSGLYRYTLHW